MRALRHIASTLLVLAAASLATVGVVLMVAAFGDPQDTDPLFLGGIGGLLLAVAGVLGWAAWAAHRSVSRAQLLLLALVAWVFTFIPATLLVGSSAGAVLNVLLGTVAGVALLAFLKRGHRTEKEAH